MHPALIHDAYVNPIVLFPATQPPTTHSHSSQCGFTVSGLWLGRDPLLQNHTAKTDQPQIEILKKVLYGKELGSDLLKDSFKLHPHWLWCL